MSQPIIHAHAYQHFEDLQLSANEFYTELEAMIKEYNYPKVVCTREALKEGGMFSSSRDYLRISKVDHHYYVCACPFGKSFFISWWLKEKEDAMNSAVSKMPFIGKLLTGNHRGKTFYEMDSELMFTNSINSVITLAVNKVKTERGYTDKNAVVDNA